jgi:Thioesterase-like superfamily
VPDAFYVPAGRVYESTELTRGPWDPGSQHAGPPCALLGREMDRAGALDPARVARATFEILRPIPIAPFEVSARVVRPGRSVELVEGSLSAGGTEILRARAWRVRTTELELDGPALPEEPMPAPTECESRAFFPTGQDVGYHTAMEVLFASGSYLEPGPARAWMRMRTALVAGEDVSPLDRVLVAADSGNGVSAPLDYRRWLFINADLSVALRRPPRGEWVGLEATTHAEHDGVGLSDTRLHDEQGAIGRATQSLLVAARP